MRAGAERLLAAVVSTLVAAHAHHGYLFANARAMRITLIVHAGFGVWCASRRPNAGRFVWVSAAAAAPVSLEVASAQFNTLVLGLPWFTGTPKRAPERRVTDGNCKRQGFRVYPAGASRHDS